MNRLNASRVIGAVTVAWLACFAYLGFAPRVPDLPGFAAGEDVSRGGHFVATLILATLVYVWLVSTFPAITPRHTAGIAFGSAAAFGLAIELIQLALPERTAAMGDAVLDLAGATVGVTAVAWIPPHVLRRPQVPRIVGALGAMVVASTLAAIVWLTPGPDRFCPGTVSSDPLPSARPTEPQTDELDRVNAGLIGLFDFTEGSETSGSTPIDLLERGAVRRLEPLGVRILGTDAVMSSPGPTPQVVDRIVDKFTLEAWVRPDRLTQQGPARIVSHSDDVPLSEVNFHLGQERHCLSLRVNTGDREAEWLLVEDIFDRPQPAWHLVATYDRGLVRIFVDGERRFEASLPDADLSGWSPDYPLLVGNEATRDRPFRGDVYLVALYDRALTPSEVARNHDAGV